MKRTQGYFCPLVISAVGVVGTACGSQASSDPSIESAEQRSVRGFNDPTDRVRDSVVQVLAPWGGSCTGTLIAEQIVLTAAHCILDQGAAPGSAYPAGNSFVVLDGNQRGRGLQYQSVDYRVMQDCFAGACGYPGNRRDLALVALAAPVDTVYPAKPPLRPFFLESAAWAPAQSRRVPISFVGFGLIVNESVPRFRQYQQYDVQSDVQDYYRRGEDKVRTPGLMVINSSGATGTRRGDSGGPLFVYPLVEPTITDGSPVPRVQVGVANTGEDDDYLPGTSGWVDIGYPEAAAWIDDQALDLEQQNGAGRVGRWLGERDYDGWSFSQRTDVDATQDGYFDHDAANDNLSSDCPVVFDTGANGAFVPDFEADGLPALFAARQLLINDRVRVHTLDPNQGATIVNGTDWDLGARLTTDFGYRFEAETADRTNLEPDDLGSRWPAGCGACSAYEMTKNGYMSFDQEFAPGPAIVTVVVQGTPAGGVWPQLGVFVGGYRICTLTVQTTAFMAASCPTHTSGGVYPVKVAFENADVGRSVILDAFMVGSMQSGRFESETRLGVEASAGILWTEGQHLYTADRSQLEGISARPGSLWVDDPSAVLMLERRIEFRVDVPESQIRPGKYITTWPATWPTIPRIRLSAVFPAPTGGPVFAPKGEWTSLTPGSYGPVTAEGVLYLAPGGVYYFESLMTEPGSYLLLDPSESTVIHVKRGPLNIKGGMGVEARTAFIGYYGTEEAFIHALRATITAPRAKVTLFSPAAEGLGAGTRSHSGAVYAKDIEVHQDSDFTAEPFECSFHD